MEFDEKLVKCIRNKTKEERYKSFELSLRYFFNNFNSSDTYKDIIEDMILLDEVKQSIIMFMSKDIFNETNELLLAHAKHDFYEGLTKLNAKYPDIQIAYANIVLFMEDYYFNEGKE